MDTPVYKSRKFYAALVALVIALFGDRAGIDQVQLLASVSTLIAYILGVGLEAKNAKG